jgi:hypothetical protein
MTRFRITLAVIVAMLTTPLCGFARDVRFAKVKLPAGKSIVFVCDGSRWQKDKIDDLADELNATVQTLTPDDTVAVMFFADDKVTGPNDAKPARATDETKAAFRSWLRRVRLGREPTPIVGLNRAFEFKPDTIVFISDGQFRNFSEVIARVAELNKDKRVTVHTIGFFATAKQDDSRSFYLFMKQLAQDNGGRYNAVYADELRHTPR